MISASERWKSARFGLGGAVIVCVALVAAPVRAEDAETRTAARDLATQGAKAFDVGKFVEAADFFGRAYDLVHAPSLGIMRARSLTKLGRLVEAIDVYEQTARFKLERGAPEAYVKAVQEARSEVDGVRARVPRVKITIKGAAPNESPEVTIDEKPTPAALLGVERPLDPGSHHLAVVVGTETRSTRDLVVAESQTYAVELDATPRAGAAAAPSAPIAPAATNEGAAENKPISSAPAPAERDAGAQTAGSNTRVLGYVALGIGAVGLGVGTFTGLTALHDKSRLDDVCHPQCPASSADDLSGFRSNRTISWLSYGIGLAAAATGVVLLTVGNVQHEHASLAVWPGGVQIEGRL